MIWPPSRQQGAAVTHCLHPGKLGDLNQHAGKAEATLAVHEQATQNPPQLLLRSGTSIHPV